MNTKLLLPAVIGGLLVNVASAATVWNPAGNGHGPAPATAPFGDAANWTNGVPDAIDKAVFNVPGAADATVSGAISDFQLVQGDGNDGGTIQVLGGGSISTFSADWSAVGYNNDAHLIVDAGGSFSFGHHAWIGFLPGATGIVDISGTVNVALMFGLGWSGGDGLVNVFDGGALNLQQIHGDGATSIKQNSLLSWLKRWDIAIEWQMCF